MAEYEPDDSRNVTLSNKTAPGEPPRTGPREGAARSDAEKKEREPDSDRPPSSQSQGQGQQSQSMGGMSQSQVRRARSDAGASDRQMGETPRPRSAPVAQAAAPARQPGEARYHDGSPHAGAGDIGRPQAMEQSDPGAERTRRQQAAGQDGPDAPYQFDVADEQDESSGRGYGSAGEQRVNRLEEDR